MLSYRYRRHDGQCEQVAIVSHEIEVPKKHSLAMCNYKVHDFRSHATVHHNLVKKMATFWPCSHPYTCCTPHTACRKTAYLTWKKVAMDLPWAPFSWPTFRHLFTVLHPPHTHTQTSNRETWVRIPSSTELFDPLHCVCSSC